MITEQTMTDWLTAAAGAEPLPADGQARALGGLRGDDHARPGRRQSWPRRLAPAQQGIAAGVIVLVVVGAAAGSIAVVAAHGGHPTRSSATFSSSTSLAGPALAPGAQAPQAQAQAQSLAAAAAASGVNVPATEAAPTPTAGGPRVVRTATVDVQVAAAAAGRTLTGLATLAADNDGYVQDSTSSLAGPVPSGTETLRIPSADYSRVRNALAGGAYGRVQSLHEQGQDVTSQYTDLGARLSALAATRASYLALLGRAGTIPDVLAVQAQLTAVQVQIESLQGQRRVLADTSAEATITVSVSGPPVVVHPRHRSGWSLALDRAGHGVVHDLQGLLARSGSALVVVVVSLVVVAVGGTAVVVGTRLLRRRLI